MRSDIFFVGAETARKPIDRLIAGAISAYSGSDLIHVAIGDGETVFDPAMRREGLYPQEHYALYAPGIRYMVPVPGRVRLPHHLRTHPRPLLPVVLNCLSCGRWRADTCVTAVTLLLRGAGLDLPRRIVTPIELLRELYARGYETIALEDAAF